MKKLVINVLSFLMLAVLIAALIWLAIFLYKETTYTRIEAEFTELEPFSAHMPVYFKGFKIGKVTKIVPVNDYTATRMHIALYPKDLKLPKNIKAQVRTFKDDFDYVEIDLPELASTTLLKNGDVIKGNSSANWESLFRKHAESGSLDIVIDNLGEITESVNKTVIQADGLLQDLRQTIKSNEANIRLTTKNLSNMSQSLSDTTIKVNNSVNQKTLDSTMDNLEQTTKNLENMTHSIDCATRGLTQTMDNVNSITQDVKEITNGVNCTMKKRFGGFRLIFGKPEQCCKKCSD